MKKKLLSILLVLSLMLALVPAAFAADAASGTCGAEGDGSNVTWTLDESGTLTISGTGAMCDYDDAWSGKPWGSSDAVQAVVVQEGVTHIGAYAFFRYTNCRSVSLPSSLVSIGESAFAMNDGLRELDLPEGLRELGNMAFLSCDALKRLTVPSTLETIGDNTFNSCEALSDVTLSEGLTTVGNLMFSNAKRLKTITLPQSLTTIGVAAFQYTGLQELHIPASVTTINAKAFQGAALTSVEVPGTVKTLLDGAFMGCDDLRSFTLGEGSRSVPGGLLARCRSLERVTLPQSLETIGDSAFYECPRLGEINIPDSVTTLGNSCFSGTSLRELTLPAGTTTIGNRAFAEMRYLRELHIPDTVTSLGIGVFAGDSALTTATLPSGLTEIPQSTFSFCEKLTSIEIPDGVTSIGKEAFQKCTSLTAVDLPDAVTSIGDRAFLNCQSLTELRLPAELETLGDRALCDCMGLTSLTVPDGVRELPDLVFSGCVSLTSLTLPAGLTSIGRGAFCSCRSLTAVTIPDSVQFIGETAFADMPCLQTIHVGADNSAYKTVDGVLLTKAGDVLLAYPTTRPGIRYDVPDGVTRIGELAFYGSGLMIVRFPQSLRTVGDEAFEDSTLLVALEFPAGTEEIGWDAFENDSNISDVFFGGTENAWYQLVKHEAYKFPLETQIHYQSRMFIPEPADLFTDVDADNWAYISIDFCVLVGLMSGMIETTFSPNTVTTRAQLVQVLYNFVGQPDVTGVTTPFTDTPADWYQAAIAWAYETGVVDGTSPTTFAPNESVTREQIAVLLTRFLTNVCGVERTWTPDDLSGFADGVSVSGWARAGMADAVALGLFGGTQDDNGQVWLRPRAGATRAETAALLQRMCTNVLGIA